MNEDRPKMTMQKLEWTDKQRIALIALLVSDMIRLEVVEIRVLYSAMQDIRMICCETPDFLNKNLSNFHIDHLSRISTIS